MVLRKNNLEKTKKKIKNGTNTENLGLRTDKYIDYTVVGYPKLTRSDELHLILIGHPCVGRGLLLG